MVCRVTILRDEPGDDVDAPITLVAKTALTNDTGDRRAEAAWLEAHTGDPGVVDLVRVDDDPVSIVTRHAGGTTLRTADLAPDEAARHFAAAADVVDRLHRAGSAHGKLTLDHVILGRHGPVLCSPLGTTVDPVADRMALGTCMLDLADRWERRGTTPAWIERWTALADVAASGTDESVGARRIARRIPTIVAAPDDAGEPPPTDDRGRRRTGLVGAAVVLLVVLGALVVDPPSGAVPDGPRIRIDGQVLTAGSAEDQLVTVDDACGHPATILLLDRSTETVWRFESTAPGSEARAMARVPGATRLDRRLADDGCMRVVAAGPAGEVEIPIE